MYASEGAEPASLKVYRRIFNTEFNLAFHPPKKDECKTCCTHGTNEAVDDASQEVFAEHIRNKDRAREEKQRDKERATSFPNCAAYTFDLQQVLSCPSCSSSVLFYKRKLSSYNLTVYDQAEGEAHCYIWSELHGKRGSSEIGSCLIRHLRSIPQNITDVSLVSDSCCGQNRNKYISAALMHMVRTSHIKVIDQKFLVAGHTQIEVDSVHSTIEQAKRKVQIFHPDQWPMVAGVARSKRPYHVQNLVHDAFYDLKKLCPMMFQNTQRDVAGQRINWTKMRHIRYEKDSPLIIKVRNNFDGPFQEVRVAGISEEIEDPSS